MRGPPAQLYSSVSGVLVKTVRSGTESCEVSHDTTADTGHHIQQYIIPNKLLYYSVISTSDLLRQFDGRNELRFKEEEYCNIVHAVINV